MCQATQQATPLPQFWIILRRVRDLLISLCKYCYLRKYQWVNFTQAVALLFSLFIFILTKMYFLLFWKVNNISM